jgi:hypothetical protein
VREIAVADDAMVDATAIDRLELELRQLGGVGFVAFAERSGAVHVELGVEPGADPALIRAEATRLTLGALDGEVVVELVVDGGGPSAPGRPRVRLLAVVELPDRPVARLHLGYAERQVTVETSSTDRLAVARAVVAGLGELGFAVPYEPAAAHGLAEELGSGTLVILREPRTGEIRRGLAGGRGAADSTARSVLSALNRFLSPAHADSA